MRNTILISLLCLAVYKAPNHKTISNPIANFNRHSLDTSRYTILKYSKERDKYHGFDKDSKSTILTTAEIVKIEGLIKKKVIEYNGIKKKGIYPLIINHPEKYYKQLIVVVNSKGEKEVWVNCFCTIENTSYWKTGIVEVLDGGSCYFQLKINLTTNIVYDFGVNGVA